MGKVLVVGSSVVDLTFYANRIPMIGETVTGRFVQGLGGKGFNQAVASALSGASTTFVSAVGALEKDSFSGLFIERLKELNVKNKMQFISDEPTGAAAISVDEQGRNNIIVALGANAKLAPTFLDQHIDLFDGASVLLMQFETNLEVIEQALKLVRSRSPKALTILNPAPALQQIPRGIMKQVDLFTPNETELEIISGIKIKNDEDLATACKKVVSIYDLPKTCSMVVTLGERGSYCFSQQKAKFFPAFKVKAIDTSGAGDSFNGALASAWVKCSDDLTLETRLENSIRFATAAAAISVTRPGTSSSLPTEAEVQKFIQEHSI